MTTLAESGAIVEYLIEQYGGGKLGFPAQGATAAARAQRSLYLYWLHFAEVSESR